MRDGGAWFPHHVALHYTLPVSAIVTLEFGSLCPHFVRQKLRERRERITQPSAAGYRSESMAIFITLGSVAGVVSLLLRVWNDHGSIEMLTLSNTHHHLTQRLLLRCLLNAVGHIASLFPSLPPYLLAPLLPVSSHLTVFRFCLSSSPLPPSFLFILYYFLLFSSLFLFLDTFWFPH